MPGLEQFRRGLETVAAQHSRDLLTWRQSELFAAGSDGLLLCTFDDVETRLEVRDHVHPMQLLLKRGPRCFRFGLPTREYTADDLALFTPFFKTMTQAELNEWLHNVLLSRGGVFENKRTADDRHEAYFPGLYIKTGSEAEQQPLHDLTVLVGPSGSGKTALSQHYLWEKAQAATPTGVSVMVASTWEHSPDLVRTLLFETLKENTGRDFMMEEDVATPCPSQPIVDHLFIVLDEFTAPSQQPRNDPRYSELPLEHELAKLRNEMAAAMPCCKRVTLCVVGTGLMEASAHLKSNTTHGGGVVKLRVEPTWAPAKTWELIKAALGRMEKEPGGACHYDPQALLNPHVSRYASALAALVLCSTTSTVKGLMTLPTHHQSHGPASANGDAGNAAVNEDNAADVGDDVFNQPDATVGALAALWASPRAALVCVPQLVTGEAGFRTSIEKMVVRGVPDDPALWSADDWLYMLVGKPCSNVTGSERRDRTHLAVLFAMGIVNSNARWWLHHGAMTCYGLNGLRLATEARKMRVGRAIFQVAGRGFMQPDGALDAGLAAAPQVVPEAPRFVELDRLQFDSATWLAVCTDLHGLGQNGRVAARALDTQKVRRSNLKAAWAQLCAQWEQSGVTHNGHKRSIAEQQTILAVGKWQLAVPVNTGNDDQMSTSTETGTTDDESHDARDPSGLDPAVIAVRYGMLTQEDTLTPGGAASYTAPFVGLLVAFLIAGIEFPPSSSANPRLKPTATDRLAEVALAMTAAAQFVAQDPTVSSPPRPLMVAPALNVFEREVFSSRPVVSLNAPGAGAFGPHGMCGTVAVRANTTPPLDVEAACAKAGALAPLDLAQHVVDNLETLPTRLTRALLGQLVPGGALSKLARCRAPPLPSSLVIVDTSRASATAAQHMVDNCRHKCHCGLVLIRREQLHDWAAFLGQPVAQQGSNTDTKTAPRAPGTEKKKRSTKRDRSPSGGRAAE